MGSTTQPNCPTSQFQTILDSPQNIELAFSVTAPFRRASPTQAGIEQVVPSVPAIRVESRMQCLLVDFLQPSLAGEKSGGPQIYRHQRWMNIPILKITIVIKEWVLLWVELCAHQNVCFEVLTMECDCKQRQDLYRGDSVKIRSLRMSLI